MSVTSKKTVETSYEVIGLLEGFEYEFRVKCANMGGESDWSETSEPIIPKSDQAPRAPVFREEIRDMTVKYQANATFVTKVHLYYSCCICNYYDNMASLVDHRGFSMISYDLTCLFCHKVVGHPSPVVKWYRSGKEVQADGTKIKTLEFKGGYYQLVITNANEDDATVYQVRATNHSGSISTTANLEVEGNEIMFCNRLCSISSRK